MYKSYQEGQIQALQLSELCELPKEIDLRHSLQLGIPKITIQDMLHKNLNSNTYKVQLRHEIISKDDPRCSGFTIDMLSKIEIDDNYLKRILFADKATFNVNGCFNRHNCQTWGCGKSMKSLNMFVIPQK